MDCCWQVIEVELFGEDPICISFISKMIKKYILRGAQDPNIFLGRGVILFNFQAAVVSILLYGCTTWTLTKRLEEKLDGNYTGMLRAILNRSWQQHHPRRQLYGHLPPITKTIRARRTRHAGHCWRSKEEIVSDVLLWPPAYGQSKAGRPARTFIQQLCDDTGCNPEDLPKAMNDRKTWKRGSGISLHTARHDDDDDDDESKGLLAYHIHQPIHTIQ